ncbi:MAG TPA: zinc ribbon domain-containing protein [Solirubrobacterales bacterium]|nr:zinc ribbon domain-containing protein [Solirubrobacterales bacterium]
MTCSSCGAALAEDQRYCLNCGQRRGKPRVDFRQHLDPKATATKEPEAPANGAGAPSAVAPVGPPPPEKPQRDYAPLAAAGGIAVLGIMLLIGVLIGRGTGSGEEASGTPQVITVGAAESSVGSGGEEAQTGGDGDGKADEKNSRGKAGKQKGVVAGGGADTGSAPVASESQLEALQEKTGEEYAEESAKLPDEIATPGEPPPTDNKAPGGGSGGVTLE